MKLMIHEKINKIRTMMQKAEKLAEIYECDLNLGFSGGKDSTVLKYFADYYGIKYVANFNNTQIEKWTGMLPYIKQNYPDVHIIHPAKKDSFFVSMKSGKGLPSIFRRWCCETLKHSNPKLVQYRVNIIGVRGEESKARMERGEISVFGDSKRARNKKEALKKTFASTSSEITCEGGKDKVNIYPIFDLTEKEVWEIIKTENLTLPEPYQNGCGVQRLGCSFCPFESYHENIKTIKTNPNIVKAWLRTFDDEFIRTSQKVFYGRVDGVDLFMLHITGNICNMNVANNYLRSIKSKNIFGTTDKEIFINYLKECGI